MQKVRIVILLLIGILSIVLSYKCYTYSDLSGVASAVYGGDAFTGIQNAAATTAKNVAELAKVVQFGFGSILLVNGLAFIGVALTMPLTGAKKMSDK